MAGLDPAIHANVAIEGKHDQLRASPGASSARVDARHKGGHDGWVRACGQSRHGEPSVMAGLDPAMQRTRRSRKSSRSAFPAPSVFAWMPATRAGMTDGSVSRMPATPPAWPGLTGMERPGVTPSPSWPGLTRPPTRTRRSRKEHGRLRAASSTTSVRVDARHKGGHDGRGRCVAAPLRHGEPLPSWPGMTDGSVLAALASWPSPLR